MASFSITKISPCVKIHHCPNYKYALDEKFKSFKDSEKNSFLEEPDQTTGKRKSMQLSNQSRYKIYWTHFLRFSQNLQAYVQVKWQEPPENIVVQKNEH